jgi:hypothetical protein
MKRIRAVGFANGQHCPVAGWYVKAYDPDACGGQGFVDFTLDPDEAAQFLTVGEALQFWLLQSRVKPLRPDGEPNRPLTSTTVVIV